MVIGKRIERMIVISQKSSQEDSSSYGKSNDTQTNSFSL